jgi:hypothetical protein
LDPLWSHELRTLAVDGSYIGRMVSMACFRWSVACRPGMWVVAVLMPIGFYVTMDAVVDDFGSLVRVGVPS